jgi:putative DNA methylase
MGQKLMAIVVEGKRGRVYISPADDVEAVALQVTPSWVPDLELAHNPRDFKPPNYGLTTFGALFTPRQLVTLTTFSDLLLEMRETVKIDAQSAGMTDGGASLAAGGSGGAAYSEAICVYLACVLDRMVYYGSSLTTWLPKDNALRDCMPRQALAMAWDFAEGNPIGKSSGDITTCTESIANYLDVATPRADAMVTQCDARSIGEPQKRFLFCTDPPYYDNIGYADLSDFFYVWMRRSLRPIFPDLFATLSVPKSDELVATPYRHGTKEKAEAFFLDGMTHAMRHLADQTHPAFPVTIFYAFKQSESEEESGTSSTGWETFLDAVIRAGLAINGTWPMRTEGAGRMLAKDTNALASSIVLVCRRRAANAATTSRRVFLRELNQVLPEALDEMTKGAGDERTPVAPVDLSQAIIGPGMAVFSKYAAVLEADGSPMNVKTALSLINRFLAQDDFDHDTQFCLHWFEQHGWQEGKFGDADTLARAKGTSVQGVKHAGVLSAVGGVVRLLKWADYPASWEAHPEVRLPVWEALHQLIRMFKTEGESGAGAVLAAVQAKAEAARQLAYRLYTLCERAGWSEDARAYNEIITSWSAIEAEATRVPGPKQAALF